MNIQARDFQLDFLRFIGISCIILAHQHVPPFLFQLRNFDVPLMVIISGIAYINFSKNHYKSYSSYLKSRFLRLVIPTWLFLLFYNLYTYVFSHEYPSFINIVKQATLIGGTDIGIWIIRIFVSMALIAPFVCFVNSKIRDGFHYFIISIFLLICYEVAYRFSVSYLSISLFNFLKIVIFFTFGYGLLLWYGMRIQTFSEKQLVIQIILFAFVFFSYVLWLYNINHSFILTQKYKYPPQIYYLSYAILVSVILYYLIRYFDPNPIKLIQFIGSSTLWIYLWHWFVMKIYDRCKFPSHYLCKFFIVYFVTVCIVFFQTKLVFWLVGNSHLHDRHKKILHKILTG